MPAPANTWTPGAAPDPAPEPASGDQPPKNRWWIHALLFLATCGTTFFAGGNFSGEPGTPFSATAGLTFSASIMGILLVHEMGHFIAARRHRVNASLPYFIPFPLPPIGTFGAVIRLRRPPRTRKSLLDIGCAGPLAGVVVAAGVCFLGLKLSEVQPLADIQSGAWMEGNSLLYLALKKLAHPGMGPTDDVWIHPVAWAGWIGLLVTSLNLLPAGQLDGGHILYALAGGRTHLKIAKAVHLAAFLMGMIGLGCELLLLHGPMLRTLREASLLDLVLRGTGLLVWLVWALLLRLIGGKHPPVEDPGSPLGRGRTVIGLVTLAVLLLTFTPVVGSRIEP